MTKAVKRSSHNERRWESRLEQCPRKGNRQKEQAVLMSVGGKQRSAPIGSHHSLGSLKRSYSGSMRSCRLRLWEGGAGERAGVGPVQHVHSAATPTGTQDAGTFNTTCCH